MAQSYLNISEDTPNEETRQSLENIRQGGNLSRPFSSVQELMEDLDADMQSKSIL